MQMNHGGEKRRWQSNFCIKNDAVLAAAGSVLKEGICLERSEVSVVIGCWWYLVLELQILIKKASLSSLGLSWAKSLLGITFDILAM